MPCYGTEILLRQDLKARLRSLSVSPRCPSRSLSKNALSFFLRETVSGAGGLDGDGDW